MAGFRTIVINKRCKLESQLGSLLIRSETEERVHIKEIETLIIESTAVALTAALIVDLTEAGVNVIFCNRRHLPAAVFQPMHTHFSVAKNMKEQIAWTKTRKSECWQWIIQEKIRQQGLHLRDLGKASAHQQLEDYRQQVKNGDEDNLEARAAALYFRTLFGKQFSRNTAAFENDALNYGYTMIMSAFAREIAACGYLTELGIWHRNTENAFNLASDLMEPFRIVADRLVINMTEDEKQNYKRHLLQLMFARIGINGSNQSLIPAIRLYLYRIFRFMKEESNELFCLDISGSLE